MSPSTAPSPEPGWVWVCTCGSVALSSPSEEEAQTEGWEHLRWHFREGRWLESIRVEARS